VTSTRTMATVTGVLFLITFITSIPAAFALSLRCWMTPPSAPVATFPEFWWEPSRGLSLIIKGFKPSPITTGYIRELGHAAVAV
jgi:hypothetical protein